MNAKKFLPEAFAESKPDVEIQKLANKFIEYCEVANSTSRATIKAYALRVSRFIEWSTSRKRTTVTQVTESDAVDFSSAIVSRYAPKTASEILKLVKAMFSFSNRTFKTQGNPFEYIKRPKQHRTSKAFWTQDEVDRILACAPDSEYRKFWSLMAFAGLRYFEAKSIKWKDIATGKIVIVGKGQKLASLPISTRLRSELGTPGNSEDTIVNDGTIATNTSSIRALRTAVIKAGLEDDGVNNHRFRHSFASNLIRSGVNIKAVQQLMRHDSIDITLNTYSHLLQDDLKKAVESI